MDLKIVEEEGRIIIEDLEDFEPRHIFECGQAFRWKREEDGSYTIVHRSKILNVDKREANVYLNGSNLEDFENIWYDYFDLARDYGEIKEILSVDPILKEAIDFGHGIRILNQDPYETIISFIISANNQIPRIKKSINLIAEDFGDYIADYGEDSYYSFPAPDILAACSEEVLKEKSRVGFRAKYIVNTSKLIDQGDFDLESLYKLEGSELEKELRRLPGVGPKVANCISLFALGKRESFPVDVWVKRVMEYFYFKEETKPKEISKFAKEKFKNLGGFAQQYLFYYAREKDIGK